MQLIPLSKEDGKVKEISIPTRYLLMPTTATITGAPYMHELLVMPCRNIAEGDADYAICCAVPIDAENLTIVARPAGRPGEKAAKFSAKYGQSTGVAIFDDVFA